MGYVSCGWVRVAVKPSDEPPRKGETQRIYFPPLYFRGSILASHVHIRCTSRLVEYLCTTKVMFDILHREPSAIPV